MRLLLACARATPRALCRAELPAEDRSVRAARHFLDEELERWQQQDLQWTAELLLSELATNAVLHAGTEFTVALLLLPDGAVRIEVVDRVRRVPRERRYDAEATTGRGIALVVHLSCAVGVDKQADGKVVWCELEAEPDRVSEGCGPTAPGVVDLDALLGADYDGLPGLGTAPATAASPPNVDEPVT